MKCPHCTESLAPWWWQGGGYKGVRCPACGREWWSDSIVRALHEAIDAVVPDVERRVLDEMSTLPDDAETTEEHFEPRGKVQR